MKLERLFSALGGSAPLFAAPQPEELLQGTKNSNPTEKKSSLESLCVIQEQLSLSLGVTPHKALLH